MLNKFNLDKIVVFLKTFDTVEVAIEVGQSFFARLNKSVMNKLNLDMFVF